MAVWEDAFVAYYPIIALAVVLWSDPFGVVDDVCDGDGHGP